MASPNIAIVSVNYKTADLAIDSIESVRAQREHLPNIVMYVVDNLSGDGSYQKLKEYSEHHQLTWLYVIDAKKNGGYAAGNNVALKEIADKKIHPDYVWFLNPDTCLREGAAEQLIQFATNENVTIVGSRLEDEDGTPQVSNFNFPNEFSELSAGARLHALDRILEKKLVRREISDTPESCEWLAGASLMMAWQVIADIGFMDEEYFLYYEELDYCLSARKAGHPCWYVPASRVYHAVGASTGISDKRKAAPRRPKYWFDSRRRYYLKNFGKAKLILADLFFILGYSSWLVRTRIFSPNKLSIEPPFFLRDFVRNSFIFRGFS